MRPACRGSYPWSGILRWHEPATTFFRSFFRSRTCRLFSDLPPVHVPNHPGPRTSRSTPLALGCPQPIFYPPSPPPRRPVSPSINLSSSRRGSSSPSTSYERSRTGQTGEERSEDAGRRRLRRPLGGRLRRPNDLGRRGCSPAPALRGLGHPGGLPRPPGAQGVQAAAGERAWVAGKAGTAGAPSATAPGAPCARRRPRRSRSRRTPRAGTRGRR
jgi:hypothetical protein